MGLSRARPASRGELKLQRFPGTPAYLSPAAPASIIHALVFLAEPQLLQPSVVGLIDEQSGHEGGRPVPRSPELTLPSNVHTQLAGQKPHTEPRKHNAPAAWGAAEIEPRPPPGRTHWAGPAPPRTRPPPPRGLLESSPGDSFLGRERSGCLGEETRGLLPPSERRRKPRHQLEIISSKILALKYTRLEQGFSDYNVHVIIWPWC